MLSAHVASADMGRFFEFVRHVYASEHSRRCTLKMRRADGVERWLQLEGQQLAEGNPFALVCVTDVSEREQAGARLRDSEGRMRTLLESLPDAVFVIRRGEVLDCNPAGRRLAGVDPVGSAFSRLVAPEQRSLVEARAVRATARPNQERHELRFIAPTGDSRSAETLWLPITVGGEFAELCVARDRTDQRKFEASVANNDRLATVGVLAAGVAHELNNPLTYVMMNLSEVLEALGGGSSFDGERHAELVASAREALDGTQRMARIVGDLRGLARVNEQLGAVDINAVVQRSLTLSSADVRSRAKVVTNLGQVLPVLGDEGRLTQVVLNLVLNAVQALPEHGGVVRISTAATGDHVELRVRDNGPGVPEGIRSRLFEPFVTTKEVGKGTGLGLYVCHRYVTECGGTIEVVSPESGGAEFVIRLQPADQRLAVANERPPAPAPAPEPTRRRILVVDDEPLIRQVLGRRLQELGDVFVCGGADEVYALLRAGERFDAILCDLLMPSRGGREVHAFIRAEFPEQLPGLGFMTGGTVANGDREFLQSVAPPLLRKPFSKADALSFVKEVLGPEEDQTSDA